MTFSILPDHLNLTKHGVTEEDIRYDLDFLTNPDNNTTHKYPLRFLYMIYLHKGVQRVPLLEYILELSSVVLEGDMWANELEDPHSRLILEDGLSLQKLQWIMEVRAAREAVPIHLEDGKLILEQRLAELEISFKDYDHTAVFEEDEEEEETWEVGSTSTTVLGDDEEDEAGARHNGGMDCHWDSTDEEEEAEEEIIIHYGFDDEVMSEAGYEGDDEH